MSTTVEKIALELLGLPAESRALLAEEEMIASAVFYETRSNGLGHKFLNEIARSLDLISSLPKTWPVFSDDIRRFLLQRFPFGLLYEIHDDYIYIIAVMHLHRKPFYWKSRLK